MTPPSPTAPSPALVQRYGGRPFAEATVEEVMMTGVVTCHPDTSLGDVARIMSGYGIHCVVVVDSREEGDRWSVISDLDLMAAAGSNKTADEAAHTDVVSIPSNAPLERAAALMAKRGVHHLVVVDPDTARPVGIVSTTGVTRALALTR